MVSHSRGSLRLVWVAVLGALAAPAVRAQTSLSVEQLARLKAATTFIKVQAGTVGATGSGFVVRTEGDAAYVVTNYHVIDAMSAPGQGPGPAGLPTKVQVVFDSGTATERTVDATPVAIDPERDLAVLRVAGVRRMPAPIDIATATELRETLTVYVCGFPFGERLGAERRNPEITINPASVSSIRRTANGRVSRVQLTGALNPGNSGGPVVTADGHLVGVAVTTIRGTGIGFAIPQHEVAAAFKGRVSLVHFSPTTGGEAELRMIVVDPLRVVKGATAFVRSGEPPPSRSPDPERMPDAEPVKLEIKGSVAAGTFKLSEDAKPWIQVELDTAEGTVLLYPTVALAAGTAPVGPNRVAPGGPDGTALPLPTERLPATPSDVLRLSELNRAPADHVGKEIQVDVLSSLGFKVRPDGYELEVSGEQGKAPSNLRVLIPKDLALQLSDLGVQPDEAFAVRLKGTVKKPTVLGEVRHAVDAQEVSFVHDNGSVAATFRPTADAPSREPTLGAVNRFPEKYVGRKLSLEVVFRGVGFAGQGYEVKVANENNAPPQNLEFYTSKDVATQAEDDLPRGIMLARVEGKLERISARNGKGVVSVSKVTIVNPRSGETIRELTGTGPVVFPAEPTSRPTPTATSATPAPPAAKTATAAAERATNWPSVAVMGVGVFGSLLLAGVGALAFVLSRKPSPARGRDREPKATPRATRPEQAKQVGDAPDEFPGFG